MDNWRTEMKKEIHTQDDADDAGRAQKHKTYMKAEK